MLFALSAGEGRGYMPRGSRRELGFDAPDVVIPSTSAQDLPHPLGRRGASFSDVLFAPEWFMFLDGD